jgi:tetratricopeptide (TPR) repeat protein
VADAGQSREPVYDRAVSQARFIRFVMKSISHQPCGDRYLLASLDGDIAAFHRLIHARQFDEAIRFFRQQLDKPTLFGREASLQRASLLEAFFPNGTAALPAVAARADQAFILYALALTWNLTGGYPGRAIPLYRQHEQLCADDAQSLSASLGHYAKALRQAGQFRAAEAVARRGLQVIRARQDFLREAVNLYWLGMGLAQRGAADESELALQRALRIFRAQFAAQAEGVVNAFLAQRSLWLGNAEEALTAAARAWEIAAHLETNEAHEDQHGAAKVLIAAARMKGEALVMLNDAQNALQWLRYALRRAREIHFVEEELPALRVLAGFAAQQQLPAVAREYLSQTWALAERGPFTLYHADSLNILARLEAVQGNRDAALAAAEQAYRRSWCDGPPYAYERGLTDAQATFATLNAAPPSLPPFDPQAFAPLLDIAINPADEFEVSL